MLNNSGPHYKRSKLERKVNTDILWCVLLLLLMCLTGAIGKWESLRFLLFSSPSRQWSVFYFGADWFCQSLSDIISWKLGVLWGLNSCCHVWSGMWLKSVFLVWVFGSGSSFSIWFIFFLTNCLAKLLFSHRIFQVTWDACTHWGERPSVTRVVLTWYFRGWLNY